MPAVIYVMIKARSNRAEAYMHTTTKSMRAAQFKNIGLEQQHKPKVKHQDPATNKTEIIICVTQGKVRRNLDMHQQPNTTNSNLRKTQFVLPHNAIRDCMGQSQIIPSDLDSQACSGNGCLLAHQPMQLQHSSKACSTGLKTQESEL